MPAETNRYGRLPWLFMSTGFIGGLASFILTYDKIRVLVDPSYQPACNINPIFSCGSVMSTEQASLLGVPNTIFGLIAFTVLFTFGFMLLAGSTVQKWVWQAAQVAATIGVIFMHYLFFQAVWRIGAICPWCFVVWMITIPIFWQITLFNIKSGYISLPKRASAFAQKYSGEILTVWYGGIFTILLIRFWYYWSTFI